MKGLGALLPYFRPYRVRAALGVVAILGSASLGLMSPLILGSAVDAFRASLTARGLAFYAALLVGATLVQGIFNFVQRYVLVSVSRGIENDLRNDYFEHLESLPQAYFQQHAIGDLMARGTNDLQAVRMICGPAIMYSANTLFTGLGCLVFMTRIHLPLTLVALGTMPLVAFATKVVGQNIHRLFERVQEQFAAVTTRVQENLAGVRVVRAYAREEAESRRFADLNREYVERNRRLIRWSAAFHPLLQVLVGLGFVAVLWYGGTLVSRGAITVGDFVAFNFFLGKLIWPMIAIGWVMNLVQRGRASLARIEEVLVTEPEIRDEPPLVELEKVRGELAFRRLGFAYGEGSEPALTGIELEVEEGKTIAVVGRTGSGKSTLLACIPRLVDPPPGSVLLDGVDVRRLPLATLRDAIAMVPQETFLFSVTVRENIAMGRPGADEQTVLRAARDAGLADDLARFPQGLDTVVGERGITLSGGQKQRVALARALARDPRILLLDDCLSAVDTHTEEEILGHLREVFRGRTVMLVSHRISTVREADLILVMERGRVVARGTHEQLIAAGGLYAELDRRQRLEEELAAV